MTEHTAAAAPADPTLQQVLDSGALAILNASMEMEPFTLVAALDEPRAANETAGESGQALAIQTRMWLYAVRLDAGCKTEPLMPMSRNPDGTTTAKPKHLSSQQLDMLAQLYLNVLLAERRACLANLVSLGVHLHRIDPVPPSHASTIALGLHSGCQNDLITALHILPPQCEHMTWVILKKNAGAITTNMTFGMTMTLGLASRINRPQMVPSLMEDVTFGVSSQMCSQVSPIFRNGIAHGLAHARRCNTLVGLYTWWFICQFVFTHWYLVTHKASETQPAASEHAAAPTKDVKE